MNTTAPAALAELALKKYGPFGVALVAMSFATVSYINAQTKFIEQRTMLLTLQEQQTEGEETSVDFEEAIEDVLESVERNDTLMLNEMDRRFTLVDRRLLWLENKVALPAVGALPHSYGDDVEDGSSPELERTELPENWRTR